MRRKINFNDYVGKTINNLTIEEAIHVKDHYCNYFKCKCKCGNEKIVRAINVIDGVNKSCGCLRHICHKTDEEIERVRQMGLNTRKHEEKCDYCGANNHFAKGMCKNCYERYRRNGDLEYRKRGRK